MGNKTYLILGLVGLLTILSITDLIGQRRRGLRSKQVNTIDLMFGADIGFRQLGLSSEVLDSFALLANRKLYEAPRFNARFGVNYIHGINETLSAKIGFRFASAGFNTTEIERIDVEQDINQIQKVNARGEDRFVEYKFNYQFFEIPLAIRHTLINSYCQPYFELGLSTYLYRNTKIKEFFYDSITRDGRRRHEIVGSNNYTKSEAIHQFNFLASLAMGGNFRITDTFSGFSQMIVRYQINDLREGALTEKLVSLGGEIGVRYYLALPY